MVNKGAPHLPWTGLCCRQTGPVIGSSGPESAQIPNPKQAALVRVLNTL